jgi:hypothetical protein
MIRGSILITIVIAFAGCGVRAPLTVYTGSSVTQSTAEAVALNVHFEISNTNDEPIKLKIYEYTVTADGNAVYKGRASAEQTVPRWATVESTIPIVIRREFVSSLGEVDWKLSGRLSFIPPTAIAETLLKSGFWEPTTSVHASDALMLPSPLPLTN